MTKIASIMSKKIWISIGVIVIALVILRLFLPQIVLGIVNKELQKMEEYTGHVEDIDIALIRGAYVIDEIEIVKRNTDERTVTDTVPFFSCPKIDLSVEWKALFQGKVVGELELENPKLNFVNSKKKDTDAKQDTADLRQLIRNLMPLSINRFEVNDAEVHYIDNLSEPKVDIYLDDFFVLATGLTNKPDPTDTLPASIVAKGNTYGGTFDLEVKLNALADNPTFDLNAEVKELDMVGLNDFMRAYGNFDVERGEFNVYTEFAARDGRFGGYIKPLIKDLQIVEWRKEEGNGLQIFWEAIVDGAAKIFKNQKKDQLGSKIILENTFEDPKVRIFPAISIVLRNAFIEALRPSIEQSIDIHNMEPTGKGFFRSLFEKDENKLETNPTNTQK